MEQINFDNSESLSKQDQLSREDLLVQNQLLESELSRAIKEIYRLKYKNLTEEQLNLVLQEHLNELRNEAFGKSSERYKKSNLPKLKKENLHF